MAKPYQTPTYSAAQYLHFIWQQIANVVTVVCSVTSIKMTKVIDHGSNLDVDTVAERMTDTDFSCRNGVIIKAYSGNLGTVYVGLVGVTAGTAEATDGFPINANENVMIEAENVNLIYLIASQANQLVYWIAS